jgi:imidazolonepropionase-like amidohydrolase
VTLEREGAMKLAVTNALLIDGTGEAVERATLLVENGRFTQAGSRVQVPKDADEVRDANGRAVLPGLIDLHAHVIGGNRAQGSNRYAYETIPYQLIDPNMPYRDPIGMVCFRTVPAVYEYLRQGITTIRDLGGRSYLACDLREAISQGLIVGPRVLASGIPVTSTGGVGAWWQGEADGIGGVRQAVRERVKMGSDLIKCFGDGGPDWSTMGYTGDELAAVVDEARRKKVTCTCHCMGEEAIIAASNAGFDSIEHCWLGTEKSASVMVKNETIAVPTLANAYHIIHDGPKYGMVGEGFGFFASIGFGGVVEAFKALLSAGVTIAMGSDVGGNEAHRHGHNLLELPMYVNYGMSTMDAIKAATINAARVIRMDHAIGSIEPGKIADFAIFDGNPVDDISVVVNGASEVYRSGELLYSREREWQRPSEGYIEAATAVTSFEPRGARDSLETWRTESY